MEGEDYDIGLDELGGARPAARKRGNPQSFPCPYRYSNHGEDVTAGNSAAVVFH